MSLKVPLPHLDQREQTIINEIGIAGGDIFRVELRKKVRGSNTTFGRKIESLKSKGMIEEYKRSDRRLRTAYRFSECASRLFNLQSVFKMKKWFSASQKIELFPEFERIAQAVEGDSVSAYKTLGIEPQHMFLETVLATNEPPALNEEEVREVLSLCSAFLQNIVTGRLRPELEGKAEGYIVFHYQLERPKEEFQSLFITSLMSYVSESDPLKRHRASSRLIELGLRNPDFPHILTLAATNAARIRSLDKELHDLLGKYSSYKKSSEGAKRQDKELALTQLVLSALKIFEWSYELSQKKASDFPLGPRS